MSSIKVNIHKADPEVIKFDLRVANSFVINFKMDSPPSFLKFKIGSASIPVLKFKLYPTCPIIFRLNVGSVTSGINYEGDYEIIPKAYKEQILNTKNKVMKQDVTVKAIPYYDTTNTAGGSTVYIADNIN